MKRLPSGGRFCFLLSSVASSNSFLSQSRQYRPHRGLLDSGMPPARLLAYTLYLRTRKIASLPPPRLCPVSADAKIRVPTAFPLMSCLCGRENSRPYRLPAYVLSLRTRKIASLPPSRLCPLYPSPRTDEACHRHIGRDAIFRIHTVFADYQNISGKHAKGMSLRRPWYSYPLPIKCGRER